MLSIACQGCPLLVNVVDVNGQWPEGLLESVVQSHSHGMRSHASSDESYLDLLQESALAACSLSQASCVLHCANVGMSQRWFMPTVQHGCMVIR